MKIIICFLISINILIANQTNTVKTSELELFLFKVGFESLLKDVDITKNKSDLNEEELVNLNSKIEIIMNEIYKTKKIPFETISDKDLIKEVSNLKKEVSFLKKELNKILNTNIKITSNKYKIKAQTANIRSKPSRNARIITVLSKDTIIDIDSCNNYNWCKFKNEEKYIARFLLSK